MADAGSSPTSTVASPTGTPSAATSRATSPRTVAASAFPSIRVAVTGREPTFIGSPIWVARARGRGSTLSPCRVVMPITGSRIAAVATRVSISRSLRTTSSTPSAPTMPAPPGRPGSRIGTARRTCDARRRSSSAPQQPPCAKSRSPSRQPKTSLVGSGRGLGGHVHASYGGETAEVKALLETDELIVRGPVRLKIPLAGLQAAAVDGGSSWRGATRRRRSSWARRPRSGPSGSATRRRSWTSWA